MRHFILGFLAGILLGVVGLAVAADIVGSDGYLIGWTLRIRGEEKTARCSDPYVWTGTRQIEC